MAQNFFEEIRQKKENLKSLTEKANKYGWIDEKRKNEIIEKLDNDTLCIGVIGQMKCGKSTFLNSFVFEDDVLPAATTPMTAALSVITYGERKRIVAEFYNSNEWNEQKMTASRNPNEENLSDSEKSKIKAAKELVEKSSGLNVEKYLGKTQEDNFENLVEYVGAEGKYVSITKSVTIYYPKEYLKGVEIVDTPGFNDPIVSREERTKDFLKKADVVLLMLYAGRPFDSTDRDILFKNVKSCGIGKVLIGINKYDIPYNNGNTEDDIINYVSREIRKASQELGDDTINSILKETTPITLSAEMALLSEIPMSKISSDIIYSDIWKRHCGNFEISSQSEMRQRSHIDNLIRAIQDMIDKEKNAILIAKPLNAIKAAGQSKKTEFIKEKDLLENELKLLNLPDSELEEKEEKLEKAERRLNRKINSLGDDLESDFKATIRKGKNDLEDIVDASCQKMNNIVDAWGRFESSDKLATNLDNELDYLKKRKLPRSLSELSQVTERKLKSTISAFFDDVQIIFDNNIEDFDSESFIKNVTTKLDMDIDSRNLFDEDDDDEDGGSIIGSFLEGFFLPLKPIGNLLSHGSVVNDAKRWVSDINTSFDPEPLLNRILERKDSIISIVKEEFIEGLIDPLKEQIKECKDKETDKEKRIVEINQKLVSLKSNIETIETQTTEINKILL